MFAVATQAGGMAQGTPDVCKVPAPPAPPVPTPFPNIAQLNQAVATTTTVKVMNMGCFTKASKIPMSQGDNAGVAMGASAPFVMGEVAPKTASTKLQIEGSDAVVQLKNTQNNGSNPNLPMGTLLSVSQTKLSSL